MRGFLFLLPIILIVSCTSDSGLVSPESIDNWDTFTATDGLASNRILSLFEDSNGDVWIGTGNGVSRFREGAFASFPSINPQIGQVKDDISDFKNVGIIPHGVLHFLPFQALMDKENNYLIADKNLFYSPSASIYYYTHLKEEPEDNSVLSLALGDHAIGEHNALPRTEFEVNQIAQFYDQYTPRYREDNSESFFKDNAGQFSVIHVATHGILSEAQPLYSYLLMAPSEKDDGRLTVHEIMDLNLNSKLVTLSACETALGDLNNGDELVGLSRAFLYAGTAAVIVSLWTVDDVSTSILMTKFHQFLNEGNKPAIALSMAQREMLKTRFQLSDGRGRELKWENAIQDVVSKNNKFSESPYYWAPFVLIGDI